MYLRKSLICYDEIKLDMKKLISIILILVLHLVGFSQSFKNDQLVANSAYAELSYAGKIMAATINYERYVGHSDYITFYAKIGGGYYKLNDAIEEVGADNGYMVPITIQTLLFNTDSHLELGFGLNIAYENLLSAINLYPIVNLGYRIQPLGGGLVMRFNVYLSHGPFPGFSVGYAF